MIRCVLIGACLVTVGYCLERTCAGQTGNSETGASESPNFIVFLADDMGYGDAGCYGHPRIQTPNLDRFAREGLRLTNCHAADSVCSPSRSSILTGRTPFRNGVWRWIPAAPRPGSEFHLRTSEITIAELLKERGYTTCHSGKWHLNGHFNSPEHPQPNDHGYDWWFATQNNAFPSHKNPTNFVRNGKPVGPLQGFSAVLVVEEAIDWLRNHRDKSKPFFLTVWTHEPHLPIESDPKFMALYDDIDNPGIRQHHGNVTQLDHAFGMLMRELDAQKLSQETVVFFTSDNGPEGTGKGKPEQPESQANRTWGSTGGLRGRKRHTYEGGIRVPGIVRWPGQIKPGSESDVPVYGCDIFSTICDIVDIPLPADRVIDGASIVPLISGKPIQRKQPMYWRNTFYEMRIAIIDGDWKIVGNDDRTKFELYNIKDDRAETTDVSDKYPERFERMKRQLIEHDLSVLADGPDWWKNQQRKPKRNRRKGKGKGKGKQSRSAA